MALRQATVLPQATGSVHHQLWITSAPAPAIPLRHRSSIISAAAPRTSPTQFTPPDTVSATAAIRRVRPLYREATHTLALQHPILLTGTLVTLVTVHQVVQAIMATQAARMEDGIPIQEVAVDVLLSSLASIVYLIAMPSRPRTSSENLSRTTPTSSLLKH